MITAGKLLSFQLESEILVSYRFQNSKHCWAMRDSENSKRKEVLGTFYKSEVVAAERE